MNISLNVFNITLSLLIIPFLIKNIFTLLKEQLSQLQSTLLIIYFLTHPILIETFLINKFFITLFPLLITIYALNLRKENSFLLGHIGLTFSATLNPAYLLPALILLIIDIKKLKKERIYFFTTYLVLLLFYFNQFNLFNHNILFSIGNFLNAFYFAFTYSITNFSIYKPINSYSFASIFFLIFSLYFLIKNKNYTELYSYLIFPITAVFFYSIIYPYDIWNEAIGNSHFILMPFLIMVFIFIKTMPRLIIYAFIFLNFYSSINFIKNWFPVSAQIEQNLANLEFKPNAKQLMQRTLSWQYFFEGNQIKAVEMNTRLIEENSNDPDLHRENIIFQRNLE